MSKIITTTIGDGEDIVIVPGWAMPSVVLQDCARILARSYRVTLIDFPKDHIFSLTQTIEQLAQVVPNNSYWIGWSLGGTIAMQLATIYPQLVKRMALVTATPCFIQHDNWPGVERRIFNDFLLAVKNDLSSAIKRFIALQLTNCRDSKALLKYLTNLVLNSDLPTPYSLVSGLNLLLTADLRLSLSEITATTLFVFGQHDILVPIAVTKYLPIFINTQVRVIKEASHLPFTSHQQMFLTTVIQFFHEQ